MLWGLVVRKERWGLSWRGRLMLAILGIGAFLLVLFRTHPFLAVTQRVDSDVLVVEGWIREFAIDAAVDEWESGRYARIYSTGGPVRGLRSYKDDSKTAASVAANLLIRAGVPARAVQMVPSRVMERDRTYSSAVALRQWFMEHGVHVKSLNVMTEDVHARRTRDLYRHAFGNGVAVGIIAIPDPDYDGSRWWRYSEGVRDVVSEGGAWLYTKLFFRAKPVDRMQPQPTGHPPKGN